MSLDLLATQKIAKQLSLTPPRVETVLKLLLDEKCTIPFISRYRKEVTGGLDEVQIATIQDEYNNYLDVEKRRAFILEAIKKQEALTPALEKKIAASTTLNQLEDIYAPFKTKVKTKGQKAKDAGLEPLATLLKTSRESLLQIEKAFADKFLNPKHKIDTFAQAIEGAMNIIIEEITHNVEIKERLRLDYWNDATILSAKRKDAEKEKDFDKFKDYFEFEQKISDLKNPKNSHRFLAVRRGLLLNILKVDVNYNEDQALATIKSKLIENSFIDPQAGCGNELETCIKKAYKYGIHTSLDLEIKSELKALSDDSAIDVFSVNLKNLLLQPYLGQKSVLGIDPGVRTGCKVAVIDKNGNFLVDTVIYPHAPHNDVAGAKNAIEMCLDKLNIKHIAVGNGTFGRETLQFLKDHVSQVKKGTVQTMLVNEDGASIYSASEIARKEFPDKDVTVRGAISIARRFQDPLAELVKIDPKSIGVGQYQHDVSQTKLKKSLTQVVENCVNFVGVDINTASAPLLSYISGIGPTLAENIVKLREKTGGFKERSELLKVSRFSEKIFEQSAGFLRIYDGANPLDATFIHPEKYPILLAWCKAKKVSTHDLVKNKDLIQALKSDKDLKTQLGEFTHADIVKSLEAPSQDPRTEFVSFEFRNDISAISDLKVGQYYPGVVTNITQFGAFVDIGIKENGLIHVSQMSDRFVENALDVLKVGQEVNARVLEVDLDRKRIALSLKSEQQTAVSSASGTWSSSSARGGHPSQPSRPNQTGSSKNHGSPGGKTNDSLANNPFAILKDLKTKR
ncbi:MAG: RNA-binding transcriptional accessory protein [Bdellovibrionaceae bacterium]|nr:RNA-binding transcriptional accessory protein [Pseudobdellovibrionaceae bacterium]